MNDAGLMMAVGGAFLIALVALLVFIAVFLLTLFIAYRIYKRYIATETITSFIRLCKTEGYIKTFLTFDRLITPKTLQFLYIWAAIWVTVIFIVILVGGLIGCIMSLSVLGIIAVIFTVVILFPLSQILVRIGYEGTLVIFKINENVDGISKTGMGPAVPKTQPGVCPQCGHQNSAQSAFCRQCGASLRD